jgi:hypothetical protein
MCEGGEWRFCCCWVSKNSDRLTRRIGNARCERSRISRRGTRFQGPQEHLGSELWTACANLCNYAIVAQYHHYWHTASCSRRGRTRPNSRSALQVRPRSIDFTARESRMQADNAATVWGNSMASSHADSRSYCGEVLAVSDCCCLWALFRVRRTSSAPSGEQ